MEKDFYMLEGNTESEKLAIENYFASEIEAPYQSHYEKWIDGSEFQLTSPEGKDIPTETLVKKDLEKNRHQVIQDQMGFLENLVRILSLTREIAIIKIESSNGEFITSDVPVILEDSACHGHLTPFAPEIILFLAIDPKHMMVLCKPEDGFATHVIGRASISEESEIADYNELYYLGPGRFIFGTLDGITSSLSHYRHKPPDLSELVRQIQFPDHSFEALGWLDPEAGLFLR